MCDQNLVLQELLSTEATYLELLLTVTDAIIIPLREQNILDPAELNLMFGPWSLIYGVHKELYENLTRAINNNNFEEVGQILVEFCELLVVYESYVSSFEVSMSRRAFLISTNKRFAQFAEDIRRDIRCVCGLESLLIAPVQRVPRLRLLIEQLHKDAPEDTPAGRAFAQCARTISRAAQGINEAMNVRDNRRAVMEAMLSLDSKTRVNLVGDGTRRLVLGGDLSRIRKKGKESEVRVWLFSDRFIVVEKISQTTQKICIIK